jgi:hypothetical protein
MKMVLLLANLYPKSAMPISVPLHFATRVVTMNLFQTLTLSLGLCEVVPNAPCDDENACTIDSCDPHIGCQFAVKTCDDNSSCTTDTCDELKGCEFATIDCDDQNPCTIDECDPEYGCTHTEGNCVTGSGHSSSAGKSVEIGTGVVMVAVLSASLFCR